MDKRNQTEGESMQDNSREMKNSEAENNVQKAHSEAERDIAADPDLSIHSPNDDLDEEESARLGDNTGLV